MATVRSRAKVAIIGIAAVAAAIIYLWIHGEARNPTSSVSSHFAMNGQEKGQNEQRASTPKRLAHNPTTIAVATTKYDYKKLLSESHNYWQFALTVLPAARAGNPDAEFFLSKALKFCDDMYSAYFQINDQSLTLDEGLQRAAGLRLPIGFVQSIYDRCADLQTREVAQFGNAFDWLEKATVDGQPAAQAVSAVEILQQQQARNFLSTGAAPTPQNTAPLIGNGEDPAELIRAAVKSGDPEALFYAGYAQAMLNAGSGDSNTERLAWMLVACERGFDCSSTSDWASIHCRFCDTSSPVNMMRGIAGDAWPSVQKQAQEISAKLAAGKWNELGLGS